MPAVRLTDPRMTTEMYYFQRIMGPEIQSVNNAATMRGHREIPGDI